MPVDAVQLARFLIGKMLVRILAEGVAAGRIVEAEAYASAMPPAAHYRRRSHCLASTPLA
jgi:DNA-3-methyladenine glycosylase